MNFRLTDLMLKSPGKNCAQCSTGPSWKSSCISYLPPKQLERRPSIRVQVDLDVPADAKAEVTRNINQALEAGWQGLDITELVPLAQIARAHELVEHPSKPGRVIVAVAA
jgi:hypothetical protein